MADETRMFEKISATVEAGLALKHRFFAESARDLVRAAELIADAIRAGGKLMICGNGGSAADAQHIAAELVHRLDHTRPERPGIPALALTTDSSTLTAIANDADFRIVFSRQVSALGKPGDVLLGISTSGNSGNVVEAVQVARALGLKTVALLGNDGGRLRELADVALIVPAAVTPRIQEVHLVVEHLLCELVEDLLAA